MASISIPTNNDPTPASRKAWSRASDGAFIGWLASCLINPLAGLGVMAAGTGIGYLVGYNEGLKQQHKELATGRKEVPEPTFFNSTLNKGWILGMVGMMCCEYYGAPLSHSLLTGMSGLLVAGSMVVAGGMLGKQQMRVEYERAKHIAEAEQQKSLAIATGQSVEVPQLQMVKFVQAEQDRRMGVLVEIKNISPDAFRAKLQDNVQHHGIAGLNMVPVADKPGFYTVSWKESTHGIRGLLSETVGAEEERVRTAIEKAGGVVYSDHKSPPGLNPAILLR